MTGNEIRRKYLEFFKEKGHAVIPSASLMPENDPTTLFTSSGMQPLIPYLMGEKHPAGKRLVDSQKSFRSGDIEEVGDNRHNTFFEMLGNWSLGDYFKKEQLNWFFEFMVSELKLDPKRLYVTVYSGNADIGVERDDDSIKIWKEIYKAHGIGAKDYDNGESLGMRDGRIFYYGDDKNWWSRSGAPANMPIGEIGGPDSEVFYDLGAELKRHENSQWKDKPCHVNCDCGRFIEVGNSVFIEFIKTDGSKRAATNGAHANEKKGCFEPLKQKNVDFGGGLERLAMVSEGKDNVFETDLFINVLNKVEELSDNKKYRDNMKAFEVIADHMKGAAFIMGDDKGVAPANVDQGYIVRRLIRRAIRFGRQLGITKSSWAKEIAQIVIADYKEAYPELERNAEFIINEIDKEEDKFMKTLVKGEKMINGDKMDGEQAFNLFQTYGYPIEMTKEICREKNIVLSNNFDNEFKKASVKHSDLSRTASAGKFKGGLADSSEETTELHTVCHLLLESLKRVLGDHVHQKGSNITAKRLRFDFSHSAKLTDEEKSRVEKLVNEAIKAGHQVSFEEMSLDEAKKLGAEGVFESKYGDKVKVYSVGNFSTEVCGGPHVSNTQEIKGVFKIKKEQSSSAGVRRIKGILQ